MANQGGHNLLRDYRKGNWAVQETMVLIEAKKMDDERRMKRQGSSGGERSSGGKGGELRWKWIEEYCWRNGCLRSQNQCNDKWDNLMRDFKRVREYERRLGASIGVGGSSSSTSDEKSYWKLERNDRKANNLPSNMLPQIYEALFEVVERKAAAIPIATQPSSLPPPIQHPPPVSVLPLPPPPPPPVDQQQHLPTSDSDTSEHSDSPAKRRRGEETSGAAAAASGGTSNLHEVGTAISSSASMIAEAIQASEEREEKRHRELLSLHERRLQIEESKADINRQGINGLVDAINKLANSILALASQKNQSTPK